MVKDLKRSIWAKYRRRRKSLYLCLEDFICHSEDRLDPDRAGKIHNREETKELLEKAKELFDVLPVPNELSFDINDDVLIDNIINNDK